MFQGYKKLDGFLSKYQKFIISTHESPDGDGLGAEIAFRELLIGLKKTAFILNSDPIPDKFLFIDPDNEINIFNKNLNLPSNLNEYAVFVLDTNDFNNIGAAYHHIKDTINEVFIIDHHEGGDNKFEDNFIKAEASSASEIIYDILKYYSDYVRPNNMVLAIYGDIDSNKTKKDVEKIFSSFKSKRPPDIFVPEELQQLNTRKAVENKDKLQTVIILGFLGPSINNLDYYSMEVLNSLLNGLGSRMFEKLRGEKALAYYVGSNYIPGLETGAYLFYIGTISEKKEEAINGILEQIDKLREEDISPEELEMAKRNLIGEKSLSLQTIGSQAFSSSINELFGLGHNWDDLFVKKRNPKCVYARI